MHLSGCDRIRARRSTKEEHNCANDPLPGGTTPHDRESTIMLRVSGVAQNNPQTWGREKAGLASFIHGMPREEMMGGDQRVDLA